MTNKVLLASRRSLGSWVKNDHCMIKFPYISNVNSNTLIQGRWKIPSLKCTFTLKLIVALPLIFKRASTASVFQMNSEAVGVTVPQCTITFHKHHSSTGQCFASTHSDWLSPWWQTVFEMHLFVPSMLGRSLGQGPCWLCAHATPCTLPVKSSGFCMQGRREDADGPVAGAGGSCFLLLTPLWWLVLVGWGVVTWEGVGREWKEEKTYVLLPCLQTLSQKMHCCFWILKMQEWYRYSCFLLSVAIFSGWKFSLTIPQKVT